MQSLAFLSDGSTYVVEHISPRLELPFSGQQVVTYDPAILAPDPKAAAIVASRETETYILDHHYGWIDHAYEQRHALGELAKTLPAGDKLTYTVQQRRALLPMRPIDRHGEYAPLDRDRTAKHSPEPIPAWSFRSCDLRPSEAEAADWLKTHAPTTPTNARLRRLFAICA